MEEKFLVRIITGRNDGCFVSCTKLESGKLHLALLSPRTGMSKRRPMTWDDWRKNECDVIADCDCEQSELFDFINGHHDW